MNSTTGYQVGSHCFFSYNEALDYQMSSVVPTITSSGILLYPEHNAQGWFFNNQQVQLTFPSCDPYENYNDGVIVGAQLIALMAIAFVFKQAIKLFKQLNESEKDE